MFYSAEHTHAESARLHLLSPSKRASSCKFLLVESPPLSPTTPRSTGMSRSGSAEMRDPPRIHHIKVDSSKRLEEDYSLGQKLGEGTFGVVIEAEDIKEKTLWAVKKVRYQWALSGTHFCHFNPPVGQLRLPNELRLLHRG